MTIRRRLTNGRTCFRVSPARAVFLVAVASSAAAGQELKISERPTDADGVVALYEGSAPGSEGWAWKEQLSLPPWGGRGGRLVRNVVQPTLTIFQPPNKARAARTAVIVAPGGGFRWLSIDSEGYDVARALAARGVTAVVLKYRLNHTADDEEAFKREAIAFIRGIVDAARDPGGAPPRARPALDVNPASNPGIARLDHGPLARGILGVARIARVSITPIAVRAGGRSARVSSYSVRGAGWMLKMIRR